MMEDGNCKIVALLARTALRDLYDINNMLYFGLFDEVQEELLRKCVVFYTAVCSDTISDLFDINRIDSITKYKIRTDLLPVIRKKERFDLPSAQSRVKKYLTKLLILTSSEMQFLDSFRKKEYHPKFSLKVTCLIVYKSIRWFFGKCSRVNNKKHYLLSLTI